MNPQIVNTQAARLAPPISANEFRNAVGHFATGVTVMTARDGEGNPFGLTATSFASLSLDPPLVHWAIRNEARSFPTFTGCASFAVNILAADQQAVSRRFATYSENRFEGVELDMGYDDLPLIRGAMAWVECAREGTLPGGDHTIILGRVIRARTFDKAALLHWRGGYFEVGDGAYGCADRVGRA